MPKDDRRSLTGLPVGLVVALMTVSCASAAAPLPHLDFDARVPAPAVAPSSVRPLRVAVAAILSPESSFDAYSDLLDYLSDELGRPAELVQRRTYEEINELVRTGEVDIAFVCTSGYVIGHDAFGMQLVAAPVVAGTTSYHSVLIVPADSGYQAMQDLRGATFAFTDPWSTTGRLYPTALVRELGSDPGEFFGRTIFTYSHDRAIEAVVDGIADGAAVDSLVLDAVLAERPELAERIRIIGRSPDYAIPPVVASPRLSATQTALVAEALENLDRSSAGRTILDRLRVDEFVPIDDGAYETVRTLLRKAQVDL